jgi:hypothetical protein
VEDYRENVRIASLTYGGIYAQSTNFNGINEFNLSLANFKDLDDKYESIQKLHSRDTNLIVFQEDKVHRVPYLKNILFDATGDVNVTESQNVLGTEVAYGGNFGISKNPESFASYNNALYFVDVRRGVVCRLDLNGIIEISEYGMENFFEGAWRAQPRTIKLGAYDLFTKQYVLAVKDMAIPTANQVVDCGSTVQQFALASVVEWDVVFTASTGELTINYNVTGTVALVVIENGSESSLGNISGLGSVQYNQNDLTTQITIRITAVTENPDFIIDVPCPVDLPIPVVANNDTAGS